MILLPSSSRLVLPFAHLTSLLLALSREALHLVNIRRIRSLCFETRRTPRALNGRKGGSHPARASYLVLSCGVLPWLSPGSRGVSIRNTVCGYIILPSRHRRAPKYPFFAEFQFSCRAFIAVVVSAAHSILVPGTPDRAGVCFRWLRHTHLWISSITDMTMNKGWAPYLEKRPSHLRTCEARYLPDLSSMDG
ncbi:hypothetical protein CCUS01_06308 [Colletotrichum cuscutae]|uniref:Secreted protein n=1 Tax=Colletotrichum cuscutae TaxID=1209917 RepID=A0AAI9Y2V6_9PEZI|nr:hypothetical protein CCUS01_06308 [Colletotrichum cuscutae]